MNTWYSFWDPEIVSTKLNTKNVNMLKDNQHIYSQRFIFKEKWTDWNLALTEMTCEHICLELNWLNPHGQFVTSNHNARNFEEMKSEITYATSIGMAINYNRSTNKSVQACYFKNTHFFQIVIARIFANIQWIL